VLLTAKSRPLLGLDITTSSVKLIELSMSGGQYRVESYAAEATPPNSINEKAIVDASAVGEAIKRAVKRSGARAKDAAVAISGDAAITKVIQMPRTLSENELEGQVEMQADQYIPFPMEEVSFDFEVIGPSEKDPDMLDVLLVATRSENVEQRVAACADSSNAGRRAEPRRRGRRLRREQHHVQRAARSEGHLHARFRLRRPAAH
jgi:type IV pilus assembly protein PilM